MIAAKVFGSNTSSLGGAKITLGCKGNDWPFNANIDTAVSFGNELVEVDIDKVVVDETNRLVTAAAYMKGTATAHQVYDNIEKMVNEVVKRS